MIASLDSINFNSVVSYLQRGRLVQSDVDTGICK